MGVKAVFFDVANTLLHKPDLYPTMQGVFRAHGADVPMSVLIERHRLLSEVIPFPDRTSRDFYQEFNQHLLLSFGLVPDPAFVHDLYLACRGLEWAPFPDVPHLDCVTVDVGILSNWDTSLGERLGLVGILQPRWVFGSEQSMVRKPDRRFFEMAVAATGLAPEEIAYVGDSPRLDIVPGLEIGLRAILIDREDLYPYGGYARIRSFAELEGVLCG
jgi:FMN phosphatase YigB (HAD superfamily)